jgi:diaminohydroxyphosphoribosylaminopyrimidine deaminase/5-amino-6-(5-phosphoribosylamino)uracil reductase
MTGAVVVRDGEVIGEGFHAALGELHAERAAIEDVRARGFDPAGSTIYVTLEPCAHTGRQPPCTEAILEAGISRVVYASEDPTEKASGRGPGMLRDGGVEVELAGGPEAAAARLLNQPFRKRARTGRPLVTYKAAMSLDGRVASPTGDSRWISSTESRELVHRWREESDAVAVGIGTALADDPLLTARLEGAASQPTRIVFDSQARLPIDSALVNSTDEAPLIVICAPEAPSAQRDALERAGAEVIVAPGRTPEARLEAALDELGRREVQDLLVEGGPTLAGTLFDAGEIDAMRLFVAPVVVGAAQARAVLEGEGVARIAEGTRPLATSSERIGEDILIHARLREW